MSALKFRAGGEWHDLSSGGDPIGGWTRPADWLPMPELIDGDRALVGLYSVYDHDSNLVALSATGAYQVDWGDGTVETFASGAQAEHRYAYADLPGTESTRGYRQAIITVTPTGATWTKVEIGRKHSQPGLPLSAPSLWLDVACAGSALSTVALLAASMPTEMEQFAIVGLHSITTMNFMFRGCTSLQSIPEMDTSQVTEMSTMFRDCVSLQRGPMLDTSAATQMANMFRDCSSLQTIPLLDTSSADGMSYMFYGCPSLQSLPALDTSAASTVYRFTRYCYSLARSQVVGTKVFVEYTDSSLSADAINEIFTNLATVAGQTITITGNYGAATCDRTIATSKGWTVTG